MRDCTSWRSQNKNSGEAWTSLSARRSASGGSPSNNASNRAPSSITRPGSAAPRPTRNESSPAIDTHSSSNLVLPSPALPSTTTTQPVPARTWFSRRRMTASSCSRPRRGRNGASIFQRVLGGSAGPLNAMARRWRSSPTEQSRQAAACPIPALQIGIGRRRWRGSGIGGVKAPAGERAAGARPSPLAATRATRNQQPTAATSERAPLVQKSGLGAGPGHPEPRRERARNSIPSKTIMPLDS